MRRSPDLFAEKKRHHTGCLVYPLLLLFVIGIAVALNMINNGRIQVKTQNVTVANLSDDFERFRILHISDLHGNEFGANQNTIATMLKEYNYQAVCITGDVCSKSGDYTSFLKLIDLFVPKIPVYFITGDEDPLPIMTSAHGSDEVKAEYIIAAEAHGAIWLDRPQSITIGKSVLWFVPESICGLDTVAARETYSARKNELVSSADQYLPEQAAQLRAIDYHLSVLDETEESLNNMKNGDIRIVLTHHPYTAETLRTLQQWGQGERDFFRGVSLVLAGHYNAGQVRLPWIGALKAPSSAAMPHNGWLPEDSHLVGLSTVQGVTQYISPGLGVSDAYAIPLRLFNTPTVTILTLTARMTF